MPERPVVALLGRETARDTASTRSSPESSGSWTSPTPSSPRKARVWAGRVEHQLHQIVEGHRVRSAGTHPMGEPSAGAVAPIDPSEAVEDDQSLLHALGHLCQQLGLLGRPRPRLAHPLDQQVDTVAQRSDSESGQQHRDEEHLADQHLLEGGLPAASRSPPCRVSEASPPATGRPHGWRRRTSGTAPRTTPRAVSRGTRSGGAEEDERPPRAGRRRPTPHRAPADCRPRARGTAVCVAHSHARCPTHPGPRGPVKCRLNHASGTQMSQPAPETRRLRAYRSRRRPGSRRRPPYRCRPTSGASGSSRSSGAQEVRAPAPDERDGDPGLEGQRQRAQQDQVERGVGQPRDPGVDDSQRHQRPRLVARRLRKQPQHGQPAPGQMRLTPLAVHHCQSGHDRKDRIGDGEADATWWAAAVGRSRASFTGPEEAPKPGCRLEQKWHEITVIIKAHVSRHREVGRRHRARAAAGTDQRLIVMSASSRRSSTNACATLPTCCESWPVRRAGRGPGRRTGSSGPAGRRPAA